MKRKWKLFAVVLAIIMAFSLAGCAPNESTPTSPGGEQTTTPSDTLTIALNGDIDEFNPFTNQTLYFINTMGYNMYESLLHLDENLKPVGDLATSWEQPDPQTYIFHLREGVKFHNGETMTAEDVKFSFEYTQDETVASWLATYFADISSIEIVDESTIKISLSKVNNAFLDSCAMLKIVKKGTEADLKQKPIGTGAFKFVSWTPNDRIVLEKFDDYWDADKVKLEKIELRVLPDKSIQIANLQSNTIQFMDQVPVVNVDTIKSNSTLQLIQTEGSTSTSLFEVGRHNCEPFSDPTVMAAMGYALDKETINEVVYNNYGTVGWSPYPTSTKYYKEEEGNPYNIEKAKELLATTKWADGFEFDLCIDSAYPDWEKIAVIYQADLEKIGIKMNIKKAEFSEWLETYLNRTYDMILNQYPMVGSDPATYNGIILAQLVDYQTKDLPELNELITQGASETDEAKRAEIYGKIQDIVVEYKPVINIIEDPRLYAAAANLKGVEINPAGHIFLKNATLG